MNKDSKDVMKGRSGRGAVDAFLDQVAMTKPATKNPDGTGRLLFAMDATASRGPTWDMACHTQAEMFEAAGSIGGLSVQLAFYRGFGEFKVSPWLSDSQALLKMMTSVSCLAGQTQIHKVLQQAINETRKQQVNALVFVGDVVEEDLDALGHLAGELGLKGVPAFMFHEGVDRIAETAFRQIATLTRGAYCRFNAGSADTLKSLLSAVAVYAVGGRPALEHRAKQKGGQTLLIADQMKG